MDDVAEYVERLEDKLAKAERRADNTFIAALIVGALLSAAITAFAAPEKLGHGWVAVAAFFIAAFAFAWPMGFLTAMFLLVLERFRRA
jgi:formate/nitrite transporter FocA (FNT family)